MESPQSRQSVALGFWLLSVALFWQPLLQLARLSLNDERSSHVLLIPVITASLIYLRRRRIFEDSRYCPSIGLPLLIVGLVLWPVSRALPSLNSADRLAVAAVLMFLVWNAGFVLFYGTRAFKSAIFPLLFLVLMIPLPGVVADHTVSVLQSGSADTSYALFRLIGVPVARNGFRFSLPGVDIEIAEQCSGIRSALSLFITGLLVAHLFLGPAWKKVCLILCLLPIAIFKNAVRIVTLSWLGVYVDPDFFYGSLHHRGGLLFSLPAFGLLLLVLRLLNSPRRASSAALQPPAKRYHNPEHCE